MIFGPSVQTRSMYLNRDTVARAIDTMDEEAVLIVDTKRCNHSKRLMEELRVRSSLSKGEGDRKIRVVDILGGSLDSTWIPGVPLLISRAGDVALGLDAWNAAKQTIDDGARLLL